MSCSPRMQRCKALCEHRALVTDYNQERERQEQRAIEASNGYDTELRDWLELHPYVTFKEWLIGRRRAYGA